MKGKKIEKKGLIEALRRFLKDDFSLVLAFVKKDGFFRTRIFRRELEDISLVNPVFHMNTSVILRRIFTQDLKMIAILRPCETRAYVELKKLAQIESHIICGSVDCFGTVPSRIEPLSFPEEVRELKEVLDKSEDLRNACRACSFKSGKYGDFGIRFDSKFNWWFVPYTEMGKALSNLIDGEESELPEELKKGEEGKRLNFKSSLDELRSDLERCVMCLNCRDMCPVCYCVDCLFNKEEYVPKGDALMNLALSSEGIEVPKGKEIYHMIRMYHVSQTCVGCGGCEEACPQNVPLLKYFKGVSDRISGVFNYVPGRSLDEKIPYTTFEEDELSDAED